MNDVSYLRSIIRQMDQLADINGQTHTRTVLGSITSISVRRQMFPAEDEWEWLSESGRQYAPHNMTIYHHIMLACYECSSNPSL